MAEELTFTDHDDIPRDEAGIVDSGLDAANADAAPLHEVRGLSCFARLADERVIAGVFGRSWGECCELQQLWVEPAHRRQGIARRLVEAFERRARERGCRVVFLETFSFQAPAFYEALGYESRLDITGFPHGISKHMMVHELGS